jgi:hypothetical protein
MAKRKKAARKPGMAAEMNLTVRSGYILIDQSTATGGVSIEREVIDFTEVGDGFDSVTKTTKHVNHAQLVRLMDACVKRVDYILRKYCARAGYGWYADKRAKAKVEAEVAELAQEAARLNSRARSTGAERVCYISVVPTKVVTNSRAAVLEVAQSVREILRDLKRVLSAGKVGQDFDTAWTRAKNLHKLAVGPQSDSIRFALEAAKDARSALRDKLEQARNEYKVDELPDGVVQGLADSLDLSPIDAALQWFTPSAFDDRE